MNQFRYTILYVKDVTTTISFYEKAFGFDRTFISPDNQYGELNTGSTTLSFANLELAHSNLRNGFTESNLDKKPFGMEIGITTKNVDATLKQAIAAGATLLEDPKTKPWGQVVAYARDPDGFLIEICTPMG
ncbi:MAG: glyoxalase [Candidatus Fluviicola riflensis]|nr:MAG: glyoxalase [Candidatus Fluviicola riflensis]OGS78946.1 MAG: glyoxalase [Candidatus Fluviicola riflensis]OGS85968.1 MAG: glyoxalase [Fluviicola sp. RIFCSPHIGHO2_12_FULL_43_24]OGS86377.1 MAG: glyoxalase [Fluviicola sp. RIFCSPHIGHO2_01_FULL_43_53]